MSVSTIAVVLRFPNAKTASVEDYLSCFILCGILKKLRLIKNFEVGEPVRVEELLTAKISDGYITSKSSGVKDIQTDILATIKRQCS